MAAGLDIVIPGVSFANYIDISTYPVSTNLSSLFFLGTDAASSNTNRAPGYGGATAGANVTFAAGYATFSGDHTLPANVSISPEMDNATTDFTRIAVYQKMDAENRGIFGCYSSATVGSSILGNLTTMGTAGGLISTPTHSIAASSNFKFVAQVYTAGSMTTYVANAGVLGAGFVAAGTRVAYTTTFERIGGGMALTNYTGVTRIASVAKHRSALTALQIAEIYAFYKFEAVRRGITLE